MPFRTNSNCRFDTLPTSLASRSRSRVMICDTLATESFGRPVVLAGRSTLPGASAQRILLIKGTQTMVLMRLRFNVSPWTTRTGLRKPGPEPVGSGRSAQYTCPWAITIQWLQACVWPRRKWLDRAGYRLPRTLDSSLRSLLQDRVERCTQSLLLCRPGCVIFSIGGTAAQLQQKHSQELRLLFSYPKYNPGRISLQSPKHGHGQDSETAQPANLPVVQATQTEGVIDSALAPWIGLTIPPNVLARADKVIK
jgi:hypothetical protein